jgi:hypothetical protein
MKLLSNISFKLIVPIFVVLFSLSSCTKGDEPVPSSSVGNDDMNATVIINDDSSLNPQNARTSKEVVGGDDNEDDDDSRDVKVIVH